MQNLRRCIPAIIVLAVVLSVGAGVASAEPVRTPIMNSPFSVQKELEGGALLGLDSAKHGRLLQGMPTVKISDVPLGTSQSADFSLSLVSGRTHEVVVVSEEGERTIQVQGSIYSGRVDEVSGSYVFLAVFPEMINGYVYFAENSSLYILSSGIPGKSPGLTIMDAGQLFQSPSSDPWVCGVIDHFSETPSITEGEVVPLGSLPVVRHGDFFVEADHQFRGQYNTAIQASAYVLTLFSAASDIYRRDIGSTWNIPDGYLRVWETTPPWGVVNDFNDIYDIQSYWTSGSNPLRNIPRTGVHVLTYPVFGGVAWRPGICDNSYGYALSSVYGSFPQPLQYRSSSNWDPVVVTHEGGHNYSSEHTFDYNPPIDCDDGSGPDAGTIMSYCHLESGGVNNIGMRFHGRVQNRIRGYLPGLSCLNVETIAMGDYDHNGVLDGADLEAALTCINLQFDSAGCLETFDMDADNQLTVCDYDLLQLAADSTARIEDCNGDRIPDGCQESPACIANSTLTPSTTAIQRGQRLHFDVQILNLTGSPINLDYWLEATRPNGTAYQNNPMGLATVTIGPGQTIDRHFSPRIPAGTPTGDSYTIELLVGTAYPLVVDDASFQFEVTAPPKDPLTNDK